MSWRYAYRSRRTDTTGLRTRLKRKVRMNKRAIVSPVKLGSLRINPKRIYSVKPTRVVSDNRIHVHTLNETGNFIIETFEIRQIVSTPDALFKERGYITRGAIVAVNYNNQLINIRVTSRPGQAGGIFGVRIN